jgi:hypothetical protein
MKSITAQDLANWQAQGKTFRLLDVRRTQALQNSGVQIANAEWKDPAL